MSERATEREREREGVKIIHLKPILLLKLISALNGLTSSETSSNLRAGEKTFCFSFFLTELFVVSSSNPNRRRDFKLSFLTEKLKKAAQSNFKPQKKFSEHELVHSE